MTDSIRFRVTGEDLRDLDRIADAIEDPATLDRIAQDTAARLAAASPRQTGRLAQSWSGRVEGDRAVTESAVPYAGVIQGGWPVRGIEAAHYIERAEAQYVPQAVETLDDHITSEITRSKTT